MADTEPTLERWRTLIAEGVLPADGSDLQVQDDEWPWVPSTTVALIGLATAREHLHAIRILVGALQLFPSATSTLARTALLGAAQTVWMLAPDEHGERMRRSLSLVREDYRHHIKYGEFALDEGCSVETHPEAEEQMDRLGKRHMELTAIAEKYGGSSRINITEDVLPEAVRATTSESEFQDTVQLRWKSMSGAAHSLLWPHFGQDGTSVDSTDERGVGRVVVGGGVEQLSIDYFCAFHLATRGWHLFALRAGRPDVAAAS